MRQQLLQWAWLGACIAIAGCVPRATPSPHPSAIPDRPPTAEAEMPVEPISAPPASEADDIAAVALTLEGTPYRPGGDTPTGFDCSGFTRYVFGQHGIALPRQVKDQFSVGQRVTASDIRRGDLVFFSTVARGASHVALALDDDRFIHAPSSRGKVRIERLSTRYWARRYIGARRLIGEATD